MKTRRTPPWVDLRGLAVAALGIGALAGCGAEDEGARATSALRPTAPTPSPTASRPPSGADAGVSDGTPIRITFGATEITARLEDTATGRDLAGQLPLTLSFRDHDEVEKTAPLPRELSLDGASGGHDPRAGDIGYWAPDNDLVFYYEDAPAFDGIVRIGGIDGDVAALRRRSGDFRATVERAR